MSEMLSGARPAWLLVTAVLVPAIAFDARAGDDESSGATADAPVADVDEDVLELLQTLEAQHAEIDRFTAKITYQTWDAVLERTESQLGSLAYEVNREDDARRFAVEFTERALGRRRIEERKRYAFSGSWLAEYDYQSRMFIKRQIVPPGEQFDPLKLGEGPFPMPIDQRVEDVLARFEVEQIDPPDDGLLTAERIGEVYGLRLVPRSDTVEAEDFSRIDIFYDRRTWLPAGINAFGAEPVGEDEQRGRYNRTTVWLRDIEVDGEIDEEFLSVETPDRRQWDIEIREWQDR